MIVFLHIDPLLNDPSMIIGRLRDFKILWRELIKAGVQPYWVISKDVLSSYAKRENIEGNVIFVDVGITDVQEHESYQLTVYTSAVSQRLRHAMINAYKSIKIVPDAIITNTPSYFLRCTWPTCLIFHFELGVFHRRPFERTFSLDPLGYCHNSVSAKIPSLISSAVGTKLLNLVNFNRIQEIYADLWSKLPTIGGTKGVFVPLSSGITWVSNIESGGLSRLGQVDAAKRAFNGETLYVAEKPQAKLSDEERKIIMDDENCVILENSSFEGIGTFGARKFSRTYSCSSSLILQALFWGREARTEVTSSVHSWCMMDLEQVQRAFSLLFHFSQFRPNKDNIVRAIEAGSVFVDLLSRAR